MVNNPEKNKPSKPCPICKKENPVLARKCVRCGAQLPQDNLWKYYVKNAKTASSTQVEQEQETTQPVDAVEPPPITVQTNQNPDSNEKDLPTGCLGCLMPTPVHILLSIFELIIPGIKSTTAKALVMILVFIFAGILTIFNFAVKAGNQALEDCFVSSRDNGKRMQAVLEMYHSEFKKYPTENSAKKDIVKFLNKYMEGRCIKKTGKTCPEEDLLEFDIFCTQIAANYSVVPDGSYYNILIAPVDENACQVCVTTGGVIPEKFIKGGKATTCRIE